MMMRMFVGAAVLLLATGAFAADGAEVYKARCAKCHGDTGHGDTAAGKALKVPALAGDAKVADASVADLVKSVKENVKHGKAGVLKDVSDADIEAAVTHAKGLASVK